MLFFLIMLLVFLQQDNCNFLFRHLESLWEFFFFIIWISFWNTWWIYFFFLNIQTIENNCWITFFESFPIFNFWWAIYSFHLQLFMNVLIFETLSGCDLIFSWINTILAAYWKHLWLSFLGFIVAFFFFIQSWESMYEPPCLKSILWYF